MVHIIYKLTQLCRGVLQLRLLRASLPENLLYIFIHLIDILLNTIQKLSLVITFTIAIPKPYSTVQGSTTTTEAVDSAWQPGQQLV